MTDASYDADTPVSEPVEIRMTDPFGNPKTLAAWLTERGTVGYSHGSSNGAGPAEALPHAKTPFPRKAAPGWQAEVVEFARNAHGTITEIR